MIVCQTSAVYFTALDNIFETMDLLQIGIGLDVSVCSAKSGILPMGHFSKEVIYNSESIMVFNCLIASGVNRMDCPVLAKLL